MNLSNYTPRKPPNFSPSKIYLTDSVWKEASYKSFCEKIVSLFPDAKVIRTRDSHMSVTLKGESDRLQHGRNLLVLGILKKPVRMSSEKNICCPNYRHFSPTAYCYYSCRYCYLAGSASTVVSPVLKIFLNIDRMMECIERLDDGGSFYVGKLQDALSLDPLTGYSTLLVPFFSRLSSKLVLLTKSDEVKNLLDLPHGGKTVLSWSLNPESVCRFFESSAPSLDRRLRAGELVQKNGYEVRVIIMPILPVKNWRGAYARLVSKIFERIQPSRITVGGLCSYPTALRLFRERLEKDTLLERLQKGPDGRWRFPRRTRLEMYTHIIQEVRSYAPQIPVALCLEEREVWEALRLDLSHIRCNCIARSASLR